MNTVRHRARGTGQPTHARPPPDRSGLTRCLPGAGAPKVALSSAPLQGERIGLSPRLLHPSPSAREGSVQSGHAEERGRPTIGAARHPTRRRPIPPLPSPPLVGDLAAARRCAASARRWARHAAGRHTDEQGVLVGASGSGGFVIEKGECYQRVYSWYIQMYIPWNIVYSC